MVDIETRKKLFEDYADCKLIQLTKEGKVVSCSDITIETVNIDKDGNVYVDWYSGAYCQLQTSKINAVKLIAYERVQGIFTSKEKAIDIVRTWFKNKQLEKIKQLEEELAELKKDL